MILESHVDSNLSSISEHDREKVIRFIVTYNHAAAGEP